MEDAVNYVGVILFFAIPLSMDIVSVKTIKEMVSLYKIQTYALAILWITFAVLNLQSVEKPERDVQAFFHEISTSLILLVFALFVLCMLAFSIEMLLIQATVPKEEVWHRRLRTTFAIILRRGVYKDIRETTTQEALKVWRKNNLSSTRQIISIIFSVLLTIFAYIIAIKIRGIQTGGHIVLSIVVVLIVYVLLRRVSAIWPSLLLVGITYAIFMKNVPEQLADFSNIQNLAVALTLLMLGIFTMITREDLISQIIGLLVMDHGLFIAAATSIDTKSLFPVFGLSLLFYILITLVILVILLPELHNASHTIKVDDQKELIG